MRILMSAATSAAATSIVRHLQALGHFVIGMDANALAADFGRQICNEFIPAPVATRPEFVDFLNSLEARFDLFIPFLDEELRLFALQKISPTVARKTLLCELDTLATCLDKRSFQTFCTARGLPVAPAAKGPPAVYKPSFGRGGKGVVMLQERELFDIYAGREGVIQERLTGMEYTVDALFDRSGKLLFAVPRKRLEAVGVSRIGEIDFNQDVLRLVERCAAEFRLSYAVNIQVMFDSAGAVHLLEINPRLAGSVMFSVLAGFDLLDQVVRLFAGQSLTLPARAEIRPLRIVRHWTEVVVDDRR